MNNLGEILSKVLRGRLFLRAIALLVAIFLWVYVGWDSETRWVRSLTLPIQYNNLQKGYKITSQRDRVQVKLRGRATNLFAADGGSITASLELRDLQPGKYRLPVRIEGLNGLGVLETRPTEVDVELIRLLERTVPVHYRTLGEIKRGKELLSVDIQPAEVVIRGDEDKIRAIHDAYISIDLGEITGNSEKNLPVSLSFAAPLPNVSIDFTAIDVTPTEVIARVFVDDRVEGRRIPFKIQLEGTPDPEWEVASVKVTPSHITIRHTGSEPLQINQWALPSVDITGINDDLLLTLPLNTQGEDFTIDGTDSVKVQVKVRRVSEVQTLLNVPVNILGADGKQQWLLDDPLVSVTVQLDSHKHKGRFKEEIPFELYVDATNIVADRIQLPVLVRKVSEGVRVMSITPAMVTLISKKTQKPLRVQGSEPK